MSMRNSGIFVCLPFAHLPRRTFPAYLCLGPKLVSHLQIFFDITLPKSGAQPTTFQCTSCEPKGAAVLSAAHASDCSYNLFGIFARPNVQDASNNFRLLPIMNAETSSPTGWHSAVGCQVMRGETNIMRTKEHLASASALARESVRASE